MLAGVSFFLMASNAGASLVVAGYALLGGISFLVSALAVRPYRGEDLTGFPLHCSRRLRCG